jgi:hypothetical protein
MLRVAQASAMPDENLLRHLNTRHLPFGDFTGLTELRGGRQFAANRPTYQTYHDWLHRSFEYEHEHATPAKG